MLTLLKARWAKITLALLTTAGLVSFYQTAFAVWMTAYPFVNNAEWRTRFYVRLTVTVVIGLLWVTLAVWLFRPRRKDADVG